jgi:hypothetical protein
MLRKETITPGTLELLKTLMHDENLHPFFLVGGTALSLQIGHRISIDIDLFSQNSFDEGALSVYLETQQGLQLSYLNKNTIKGRVNNVQVDLITHAYPLVKEIVIDETIRLASAEDIAAMKLNAIIGNGTRLKDFIDIAFLSSYLSLEQMIQAYEHKYQSRNSMMTMKALAYHREINFNEPIHFLKGTYPWKLIEARLNQTIKSPANIHAPL